LLPRRAVGPAKTGHPKGMSIGQAQDSVSQVLIRTWGRELPGNFNPLLVGGHFWGQSSNWHSLTEERIKQVAQVCRRFLEILHQEKCPRDMQPRLWSSQSHDDALRGRNEAAINELRLITNDLQELPYQQ
jgi:hypothetical protein